MALMESSSPRARSVSVVTFLVGGLLGAAIALAAPARGKVGEEEVVGITTIIYSITSLAIDTEMNAARIIDLDDRIHALEMKLAELEGDKE